MQGMWDGFQRINTETKSGGIVGVFKQGGADTERKVVVSYLDPVKFYTVKEAVSGKIIIQKINVMNVCDFRTQKSRYNLHDLLAV